VEFEYVGRKEPSESATDCDEGAKEGVVGNRAQTRQPAFAHIAKEGTGLMSSHGCDSLEYEKALLQAAFAVIEWEHGLVVVHGN
jgi:hypothetical protein